MDKHKNGKKQYFSHIINVVTIALIIEAFLCSMLALRTYAKENCFERIEEATVQTAQVFNDFMQERETKLEIFADLIDIESDESDVRSEAYWNEFCKTQSFIGLSLYVSDGSFRSYGYPERDISEIDSFTKEASRLPYVGVFFAGDLPKDSYIYQVVPVVRAGETVAILYGYTSLDVFPSFISSTFFDGKCEFYIVDGKSGDFLMDEYHGGLGNLYDSMERYTPKKGYSIETMRANITSGDDDGYYVFKSHRSDDWVYMYYMPLGINNWSIQMTIEESVAFASYDNVNKTVVILAIIVVALMFIHVLVLMIQGAKTKKTDNRRLHKSNYINKVQRALINAHSNPDFVEHALKIIADEMNCETVLLLTFSGRTISNAHYWPSADKTQAMNLIGINVRDEFPMFFDMLSGRESVIYNGRSDNFIISETAQLLFENFDVSNIIMVPIMDNSGSLKGTVAAVNIVSEGKAVKLSSEMLDCVTYDFFMAIANLENHNIIKHMGEVDYLTNIKNRNSYESYLAEYAAYDAETLWCTFIDVNGLHEINNIHGHKAGDLMLCAVADAVKKVYGEQHSYRLGGDEFVSFTFDSTHDELLKKKKALIAELSLKQYYVSVGFEGVAKNGAGVFEIERIVSKAEQIMYKNKWDFYKAHDIPTDRGHFPEYDEDEK